VLLTVYCVVFGGVNSLLSGLVQAGTTDSSRLQYTVHSQQNVSLNYKVQPLCNDNKKVLRDDDPAGSKHVGVCYD
jgi:hypothetical protein